MTASFQELDRVVLEAVSEDYQSFEAVVSKLSQANCGIAEIQRVLLSSIANKLVAAYLLHADPPYATEVGADSENISRYWFCITEEGRRYLDRQVRKQAVFQGRRGSR